MRENYGMRRVALAMAIVVSGSCGASAPVAPDPGASTTTREVSLPAGTYSLTITPSPTGLPVCQNGTCTSTSLCIGTMATTVVHLGVSAERTGDVATLRSLAPNTNLVVEFRISGPTVLATISGTEIDEGGNRISATGEVTGAAPPDVAITVSGNINGGISAGSGSCSNNGHMWSLLAR